MWLQEYLDELPLLKEMIRFANKRHRAIEMGRAGTVFCFGNNHHGQVHHWRRTHILYSTSAAVA